MISKKDADLLKAWFAVHEHTTEATTYEVVLSEVTTDSEQAFTLDDVRQLIDKFVEGQTGDEATHH